MKKLWDRQVAHIDRRIGPLEWLGVRRELRKAAFRKRRGVPSRDMSLEACFDLVDLRLAEQYGELQPDGERAAKLQWRLLRERLLKRRLAQRRAVRSRTRVRRTDTKINLWRRRREWLRDAEEARRA